MPGRGPCTPPVSWAFPGVLPLTDWVRGLRVPPPENICIKANSTRTFDQRRQALGTAGPWGRERTRRGFRLMSSPSVRARVPPRAGKSLGRDFHIWGFLRSFSGISLKICRGPSPSFLCALMPRMPELWLPWLGRRVTPNRTYPSAHTCLHGHSPTDPHSPPRLLSSFPDLVSCLISYDPHSTTFPFLKHSSPCVA